jgi:hypothetical protein
VLTDQGKGLVRQYESTYDAQKVYAGLVTHASKSTKAAMDSTDLLSYITSVRLGDVTWKGTTHAFILHWENQLRKYVELTGGTDWDPFVTDNDIDEDDVWYDAMSDMPGKQADSLFDEFGNYRRRVIVSEAQVTRHDLDDHLLPTDSLYYQAHE